MATILDYDGDFRGVVQVEVNQPTVSSRRRLQNRVAQRKFRERKVQRTLSQQENATCPTFEISTDEHNATVLNTNTQVSSEEFEHLLDEPLERIEMALMRTDSVPAIDPSSIAATSASDFEAVQPTQQHAIDYLPSPPLTVSNVATPVACYTNYSASSPFHSNHDSHNTLENLNWLTSHASRSENNADATLSSRESEPSIQQKQTRGNQRCSSLAQEIATPQSSISCRATPQKGKVEPPPLLHTAVRSRNPRVTATLLRMGAAAVDEPDEDGREALHIATVLGDMQTVSLLLRYGADPYSRDSQGNTALHIAVSEGNNDLVELLLRRGGVGFAESRC